MLNRTTAGSLRSRALEATFTFAISGAIFFAAYSLPSEPATAQYRPMITPLVSTAPAPEQHRANPIVIRRPSIPAPSLERRAPVQPGIAPPITIDPAMRQEIVARHTDEMKREHCMRKLEARRRELQAQQALRARNGK